MNYLTTIGLEVHVQLQTRTKMFCACRTDFGAAPNTQVCPVCLGYPGALPVINQEAIRLTVMTGLMVGSRINPRSKFDRKNYFYPDMPKNYQITQFDQPLCLGGAVGIECRGQARTVRLTRIHLEEDVAKNMHVRDQSRVDFNRAGHPLMEIVTEPDMHSPEEAFAFLLALKQILVYGLISPCNLEEGNLRCDVNCSVRPEGQATLGTKTEIKNMNTFKGVYQALAYELQRQVTALNAGEVIVQETRRFDSERCVTETMRTKEDAHDYRYFPDPDLMPVVLSDEQIKAWEGMLPELPHQRCDRLEREYALPPYDAKVLSADKYVADFFEEAARGAANPKTVSNWIMTEMMHLMTTKELEIRQVKITPQALAGLIKLVESQAINGAGAKAIFAILFEQGGDPAQLVGQLGLAQVSDTGTLEALVRQAIDDNPKSVADYKGGKEASFKFLMGQVMRLSKGKANPQVVQGLLKKQLGV
ncbi:MAG: Asp-tRNA(Asn)/Glu-tRNA(Gln) amidotransferase subunit GatB [Kiritimatiellae bacterium]|nr:Asp-tRNA(Asn)/Glu-tRNA(Gln) amidotransferase subunit GatB [Kiritimatiellia bacterium]